MTNEMTAAANDLESAATELEQKNRMDWQLINTAPKDGTICRVKCVHRGSIIKDGIAYFGDLTIDYGAHGIVAGLNPRHTYDGIWIDEDGHLFPQPTHWMPL